ncbi:uncharacterized protein HD556DRAFT_1451823 [Suillus plorans]|uniref:Uncharacterized protein n=1 Tax=Suillus plorans TaxID=116603 RepID=A0A9P7A8E1_9AGAM|nr:uncharacterized protein HD556DRAFT_1451823 [Suillus plorans]KAG1784384.1 hypothetical protein HD556DRAFT_1451823 [Suillus plorans]
MTPKIQPSENQESVTVQIPTYDMARLNGDLDLLCSELQTMILDELSVPDLASLAKTRTENDEGVKDYMHKRREDILGAFVKDVGQFLTLLDRTGLVVSCSSALHLVQAKAMAVHLRDMDVYATIEFENIMMDHFKTTEGYKVMNKSSRKNEYDSSVVNEVYKLEKGEKKVDIIFTDWASAIVPILQYHSTAVMNYIMARSLVSLYPQWTTEKKSLVNPRLYFEDCTNIRSVRALMKYVRRGFHVTTEPFQLGTHDCQQSAYCPHATRNTLDRDTLRWIFRPVNTLGDIPVTCDDMAVIMWCLGGQECKEDGDEVSSAFITVGG